MQHTKVLIGKDGQDSALGIDDRIFLGEGLFETLKVDSSKPCSAYLHWQRLSHSAKQLGIPFDLSFDDWFDYLVAQIKHDNLYHGGIKAILSGGSAPRGLTKQGKISQLIFQTFNYAFSEQPARLISAPWLRDEANPIYRLKTVNYLETILARRHAQLLGADDVLFFNTRHYVTETSCANLFLIKNNDVLTPGLEHGVLPGVTRSRLLSLCQQAQVNCIETDVSKSMLGTADAVFITNSLQGIREVHSLDDVVFPLKHPLIKQLNSLLSIDELDCTKKKDDQY